MTHTKGQGTNAMDCDGQCANCWAYFDEVADTDDYEPIEIDAEDGNLYLFCSDDCASEWLNSDRYYPREYDNYDDPMYEDLNPCDFRDPGGRSALRNGPRIHPCPNCGEPNMLTPHDVALGYQCDQCADQIERGW